MFSLFANKNKVCALGSNFANLIQNCAKYLKRSCLNLLQDCTGGFAVMMAITLFVIILVVGLAVDMGTAYSTRNRLQNALDTAVLAQASEYLLTGSEPQSRVAGQAALDTNEFDLSITGWNLDPISKVGSEYIITGTAQSNSPTHLMGVIGRQNIALAVKSQAIIKVKSATTIVVPDISWSMRGANLTSVQDALVIFGNKMFAVPQEFRNRLQMGSVPFAGSVNIKGTSPNVDNLLTEWEYAAPQGRSPIEKHYYEDNPICNSTKSRNIAKPVRRRNRTNIETTRIEWASGRCVNRGPVDVRSWSGCIQTDQSEFSSRGLLRANTKAPLPPTLHNSFPHCPAPRNAIKANIASANDFRRHIRNLNIGYGTAHDVGLLWATRILEPAWASFFGTTARPWNDNEFPKYVVFMSDGLSRPIGYNFGDYAGRDTTKIADNARALCTYLKSNGVLIYGISYSTTATALSIGVVQDCASPNLHFRANKANVRQVFTQLADAIKVKDIRLSQ